MTQTLQFGQTTPLIEFNGKTMTEAQWRRYWATRADVTDEQIAAWFRERT